MPKNQWIEVKKGLNARGAGGFGLSGPCRDTPPGRGWEPRVGPGGAFLGGAGGATLSRGRWDVQVREAVGLLYAKGLVFEEVRAPADEGFVGLHRAVRIKLGLNRLVSLHDVPKEGRIPGNTAAIIAAFFRSFMPPIDQPYP